MDYTRDCLSLSVLDNEMMLQEDHRVEECCHAYLEGKIPSLSLGMSGKCNMACLYCDRRAGRKKKEELKQDEKLVVLKKFISFGVQVVEFCLEGEPLLDPAFWPLIEIANKNDILPFTFSNLTVISSLETAKKLFSNNVTIAGKMDRAYDFDDLLGRKGASKKARQGLNFLLKAGYPKIFQKKDQFLTKLSVVFVPTALNYKDITAVSRKCKEIGAFLRVGELELVGRAVDNRKRLYLSPKKLAWVYQKISRVYGYDYLENYKENCFNLLGVLVGVDGNVFIDEYGLSCPFVVPKEMGDLKEIYVGNVLKDKIEDIWERIERTRIRNISHLEKRIKRVEKVGKTLGCSGKSDVILKRAVSLIKEKHHLN